MASHDWLDCAVCICPCNCSVCAGWFVRSLDLSLPRRRQGRKDRRFPAPRQARYCGCQSVLPSGVQDPRSAAAEDHAPTAIKLRTERRLNSLRNTKGRTNQNRSSKYLNNLIEQDHRSIKLRWGPMLGSKRFRKASIIIAGIELVHRIEKVSSNSEGFASKIAGRPKSGIQCSLHELGRRSCPFVVLSWKICTTTVNLTVPSQPALSPPVGLSAAVPEPMSSTASTMRPGARRKKCR